MWSAALLHDIGKLDVSRELLYKAARLTKEEFEQMQEHVSKGVSLLEPVGGSLRRVIPIVLAHHDKFDGSGYHPNRGAEIPIEARIISVADVYDSLAGARPYRAALPPAECLALLAEDAAGGGLDPELVQPFGEVVLAGTRLAPTPATSAERMTSRAQVELCH